MKHHIIATIGPNSLNTEVLRAFKERGVTAIRLNLSHTPIELIEKTLTQMQESGLPLAIDTEGSQIRTGNLGKKTIQLHEGGKVRVYDAPIVCSATKLYLRPKEALAFLKVGDLITIDFNAVLLKVVSVKEYDQHHYVTTMVLNGGLIGNNKAVSIESLSHLPAFSQKDLAAIKVAKKLKVKLFTLSFMDSGAEVQEFRRLYPKAQIIAKVETKKGVENFAGILKAADGILIDRGDLSREVAQERIPLAQKIMIQACVAAKKPVYVATNVLESMSDNLKPMKSEINDVVNTLLDGVTGFVLTKETAVGKYPVQTVNTLRSLINHIELLEGSNALKTSFSTVKLTKMNYITNPALQSGLTEPHGGVLVNRYQIQKYTPQELTKMPQLEIDEELLMDVELLAQGAYSPLEGFMNKSELEAVLDTMRLPNGLPWTMPIILPVDEKIAKTIKKSKTIALVRKQDGKVYATMDVSQVYPVNKTAICQKWFGTKNSEHPGVKRVLSMGEYYVAGKVNLLHRRPSEFKDYELTPAQTRQIFREKGWSVVVGFHTRNPIHRSHEFIQLHAMDRIKADGLFVHPVVGKKKKGDFEAGIIIKAYELMMKKFYPKGKVVMGVYATYSRYAGPREAIFTALCRKNYGCSHFVIGRDHTGVGDFYHPLASQRIFSKFPDLGVTPIMFNKVFFSKKHGDHIAEGDDLKLAEEDKVQISGTQIRRMFMDGKRPPTWFMRPEIAQMILRQQKAGKKVFVF